jgi:U3 small nucleolar ribonucleoprotein component
LKIAKSHIETKHIFTNLTSIPTNLHQCRLQINNLEKLIFIHKNWTHDPRLSFKGGPKSTVYMIELEIDLKKNWKKNMKKLLK